MTGTAPDATCAKRRARTGPARRQVAPGDPIRAVDGRMPGIMGLGGSSTHALGATARTDLNPARLTEGFCRAGNSASAPSCPGGPAAGPRTRDKALRPRRFRSVVDQPAYKPGSVGPERRSAPTWRPFLWDGRRRPPRATNPGDWPGERACPSPRGARRAAPIRSCSRWGLPCRPRCRVRGALLPHPFTLTPDVNPGRSALCGTVPGVAPAGGYPAPSLHGARTFLPGGASRRSGRPAD